MTDHYGSATGQARLNASAVSRALRDGGLLPGRPWRRDGIWVQGGGGNTDRVVRVKVFIPERETDETTMINVAAEILEAKGYAVDKVTPFTLWVTKPHTERNPA